ncbi:Fic family protein, partial [Helcococcus bovis]|uniref:Fic family protein n=1 Tax=Helcococcus bovis TaxID=3153252 RepID=UPI0038B6BE9B
MDNKEIEKIKSLKEQLLNEFKLQDKSGIYAITQYNLAYNSNKIEGSRLTEKETANLFDTGTVFSNNSYYLAKDIEEARGHFLMFNEMLKTLDENLTHEIIKSYHYQLKSGVFEDKANGYAIGEYKTRNNIIAGYETVLVEDVDEEITRLLENYNQIKEKSLIDLLEFHINFEMIHPFQDGNGRVGRII